MATVGRATVVVQPSFVGFQKSVGNEVTKTMPPVGKQAGTAMVTGMSSGITSSASTVTKAVSGTATAASNTFAGAGAGAATGFGSRLSSGLSKTTGAVSGAAGRVGSAVSSTVASAGTVAGSGFVSRFGAALGPMAGILGAAGVVGFFKGAVDEASGLGESMNALKVTYGENADGIAQLGEQAATSLGLSNLEFNNLAVRFSGFSETIAGEGGDVVGTLDELTGRASDFASVMNLDVNEAAQLFQSGLAGETEPLRQFGIDMSAASVQAYALANGIAAPGREMTEQEKVQARYGLLMQQTAQTQGDFENTSGSLANQQRILSSRFADLRAEVGEQLLPVINDFIGWLSTTGVPALRSFATWVGNNKDVVGALAAGVGAAVAALGTMKIINTVTLAVKAFNVALAANPIGLVITAIGLLVAAFMYAWQNSETFRNIVTGAWNGIKAATEAVVGWFTGTAVPFLQGVWDAIAGGATWLWDMALKPAFNWIKEGWEGVVNDIKAFWDNTLKPVFEAVGNFVKDEVVSRVQTGVDNIKKAWETLKEGFAAPINWVINTVWNNGLKKAFDSVSKAIGSDARLPKIAGIATRAKGGPVRPGQPYLVGEEGPELITPNRSGWVHTAAKTRGAFNERLRNDEPPHGAGFWDDVGGVVSGIGRGIGNAASAAVSWARGGLASAANALLDPIRRLIGSTVGRWGAVGQQAGGVATNAIDDLVKWVRGKDEETGGPNTAPTARGKLRGAQPHVNNSAWALADSVGGIRTMQAFNQSMAGGHPKGLAVDFIDSIGKLNRLSDAIVQTQGYGGFNYMAWQGRLWSPGRGWRPQNTGYGNDPYHQWHVHGEWYDDGGLLKPGMSMVANSTGRPEPVLTGSQWADIHRLAAAPAGGRELNVTVHATSDDLAQKIASAVATRQRDSLAAFNLR